MSEDIFECISVLHQDYFLGINPLERVAQLHSLGIIMVCAGKYQFYSNLVAFRSQRVNALHNGILSSFVLEDPVSEWL
jgi:hypothetical protein